MDAHHTCICSVLDLHDDFLNPLYSASFSSMILPLQRGSCGLSWLCGSYTHFQIWYRKVRKRHLFFGPLRHIVFVCIATAGLRHQWSRVYEGDRKGEEAGPPFFRLLTRSGMWSFVTFLR